MTHVDVSAPAIQPDDRALSCPSGVPPLLDMSAAPLSAQLRARTARLHDQTELILGLPGAIQTLEQYRGWLCHFFGLYRPLERQLAGFSEWGNHGLALPSPSQSDCLAADLAVLGIDPAGVAQAPPTLLPHLQMFAHALGALYVLEGSTLGGQVILRDVAARIGPQIAGATQFFGGRGAAVGQTWQAFKTALNAFGRERPNRRDDVVAGAESVFGAIATWFVPMRGMNGASSEPPFGFGAGVNLADPGELQRCDLQSADVERPGAWRPADRGSGCSGRRHHQVPHTLLGDIQAAVGQG
jgi:heme oxygenase